MLNQISFAKFARTVARLAGQPLTFSITLTVIFIWLILGPVFEFSTTWQLWINSTTTVVTVLMVFLIQNTQNRDGEAIQIKLDELIRSHKEAHNSLLDLEELTEAQLDYIKNEYEKLAAKARKDFSNDKRA